MEAKCVLVVCALQLVPVTDFAARERTRITQQQHVSQALLFKLMKSFCCFFFFIYSSFVFRMENKYVIVFVAVVVVRRSHSQRAIDARWSAEPGRYMHNINQICVCLAVNTTYVNVRMCVRD